MYCLNCLQAFPTIESRDKHYTYCKENEAVKITMPSEKEKWLYYQDGQCQFMVPFVIYADFESLLILMKENARDTKTKKLNKHEPCGWTTYSTFAYGSVPDPLAVYRGEDCVKKFVDHLVDEVKRFYNTYSQQDMLPLTEVLKREHDSATSCHICMKPFNDENRKVRDHCHYTGLCRGAAHNTCNLKYRIPNHIPVIFHNLSGYDAHLFIRELGEKYDTQDIGCIAENTEKYISFNMKINVPIAGMGYCDGEFYKKIEIRFIDSCQFMASSLEKLASYLIGTNTAGMKCQQCADTCLEFKNIDDEYIASFCCSSCESNTSKQLDKDRVKANTPAMSYYFSDNELFRLMLRRGIYPYEYMNGWRRFEETELPPREAFYSTLNMNSISDNEYEHTQKVWNAVTPKGPETTMGDYHDAYLVTDVLLFTDIFQNFRGVCHENYKLDPTHFYSAPGLSWKAALKCKKIKLELLTDPDMLLMFEKGIRCGITQAVHRYARANNKYMGDQYDPDKELSYWQYLDAVRKIEKLVSDNKHRYLLEADVDYPKDLHDKHNALPFLPKRKMIHRVEKLIPNLEHKKKYVVYIGALHQALKHGFELKKVHRAIRFNQSPWLRGYIDHNTKLRTAAKNDFEKDFYKLMNLSVFGKIMENIRNHRNVKLVTNEAAYSKLTMQPNFKNGISLGRTGIKMNKPVYISQAILDLSKTIMYEYHYDYMQSKYGSKIQLCYIDTDSFVYHIRTEDFYRDIADDVESRFDTSAYTKDDNRPLPIGKNKKVVGLMKDELGGKINTHFITLRPKAYAYKALTKDSGDRKAKG
ncbi:uncharacterized protein LOC130628676 [Hydractinia symbiolongicarpus]|uniref:uncharacterized protein LOC130628676 n=1 Tax=Hydractinia symbiolongicarpus TaxID=13093 RepID=UPI00254AF12D|nr:uncharacterized protein LOC130628676 [Hydractinia symbiolongicarpus]